MLDRIQIVLAKNTEADFRWFLELTMEFNRFYDGLGIGKQYGRIPADQVPVADYHAEFLEHFGNRRCFLAFAKDEERCIGYTAGCIEKLPANYRVRTIGQCESLFVTFNCRGLRVGEMLQRFREDWFRKRGATFCRVPVKTENPQAIRFFEKQWFKPEGQSMWKSL